MTKEAIRNYLSNEDAAHSSDSRITRVVLKSGEVYETHFIRDTQEDSLIAQNKWIVTVLDRNAGISTMNGDDIAELKVGKKPFK